MGSWDSKRTAALFLRALWRLVRRVREFPNGDLTKGDTLANATQTATDLADLCGGVAVVGRVGAGFGLNGDLLPAASLQYRDLHQAMANRHIDSIALTSPVSPDDLADLVAVAAGAASTRPVGGSVRINSAPTQTLRREGLTVDEIHRYITSVDEQRQSDDTELLQVAGSLLTDNETRHYQAWVERIRHQDDATAVAVLGELPDWLH